MAQRPSLASTLFGGLDWRSALREPRTWAILLRSMIPLVGVLTLDWSGIQAISVIALDTLAGLWCIVAVGAVVVARESWWEKDRDLYSAVIGGVFVFVIVAALMTFMVCVMAFVVGGRALASADLDPHELLEGGWVFWTFGSLLVAQIPSFVSTLRGTTGETAKSVLEPRVGYLLRRFLLAGIACSFLVFLWGRAATIGVLLMAQLVLAAHEVFGEKLHAALFPETRLSPATPRAKQPRRRRRA